MISLEYSIPAKTFLIGEYAALSGGLAIVAATHPCFKLKAYKQGSAECLGIHPDSPAGLWIREHRHFYSRFKLEFVDPYEGKGGLGASTAQFLSVYCLSQFFEEQGLLRSDRDFVGQLLIDYRAKAWNGEGPMPSGSDLLAQYMGKLAIVNSLQKDVEAVNWPFPDKGFCVVRTGNKLATHEHLRNLAEDKYDSLVEISAKAVAAINFKDWSMFVTQINNYRKELRELGLTSEKSVELLSTMNSFSEVEGAKACGAMGADMIALFFDVSQQKSLEQKILNLGLEIVGSQNSLSSGMELKTHQMPIRRDEVQL